MIAVIAGDKFLLVGTTRFPDGTNQVWKLPLEQYGKSVKIIWRYSEEAEVLHLLQLLALLKAEQIDVEEVYIPFLPYGRQDKKVSNESTFALKILKDILPTASVKFTTLDEHSPSVEFLSYSPKKFIQYAINGFVPDILVYPDAGAARRYRALFPDIPSLVLSKIRDQLTGHITAIGIDTDYKSSTEAGDMLQQGADNKVPMRALIIDDICDGGATFSNAALFLHEKFRYLRVGLYVTHGIFSKGYDGMIKAGIQDFYCTDSFGNGGYDCTEVLDNV